MVGLHVFILAFSHQSCDQLYSYVAVPHRNASGSNMLCNGYKAMIMHVSK